LLKKPALEKCRLETAEPSNHSLKDRSLLKHQGRFQKAKAFLKHQSLLKTPKPS
jgi:hypothetical protein